MRKKKVFAKLLFAAAVLMIGISGFATDALAGNTIYTITSGTDPASPVTVTTGTTNTFVNQWVSTSTCATNPNSITIASTDASSVVSGVLIKTGSCAGTTVSTCAGGPPTWTCAYAATYAANTYYVCANAHASNTGSTSGTNLAVTAIAGQTCDKAPSYGDTSPVFTVSAPPIDLTIGQGTDTTANSTVCPGASTYTEMDAFALQLASAGTRAIDSVTVVLADAGDQDGINAIKIVLGTGTCADAGYGTATGPFGSTTIPITTTGLNATNTITAYKVCVQPKAQGAPTGSTYAVNGTVSTVTGSGIGTVTDNDTASDTVNVDDLSYTAVTGFSGTAGNAKVDLTWTNGSSLTTLITNSTTGAFTDPTEGTSYSVGGFIGANKVVYKSTGAAATDSPLAVGVDMWYRAYFVDACNNYSTSAGAGPYAPTGAAPCDDDILDEGAGGCYDCHLSPPSDGTRDLLGNVVGSHEKSSHVSSFSGNQAPDTQCVLCHGSGVTSYGTNHRNGNINMAAVLNGGSYSKGASFAQTKTPTLGKCSNTQCHGVASPTWGNTGSITCSSCHPAQTGTGAVLDAKHKMHFNTSTATTSSTYLNQSTTGLYRINCGVCHDTAGQNKSHIDGTIQTTGYRVDVIFNATQWSTTWGGGYSGGTTTTATASGSGFIYYTGRTCNNLYCHSTVQADGGTGAPTYQTPNWAPATVLTCNGCHATVPATGQHATHVTTMAYACTKCHNTGAGTAPTHVNGIIEMKLINGASAVYGQGSSAARNGYRGCTNVYCHGAFNGANGTMNTPSWGNTGHGNCGTCHGATIAQTPSRINHPRHVGTGTGNLGSTGIRCADCHGSTAGAQGHENVRVSWNLNGLTAGRLRRLATDAAPTYRAATSGTTSNAAPSPSYGTCANIYCHSNAQVDGGGSGALTYGAPTWGATSVACAATACHASTSATLTTGAHESHVTGSTANYVCNNCHNGGGDQTANHTNKNINFGFLGANAVKGTYSEGASTPAGNGTYGTCNNTACHGADSPVWSNANTGNACVTCHGVWGQVSIADERVIAPGWSGTSLGVDTGGATSAADMNVGAHAIHLGAGTMSQTEGFHCNACHTKPANYKDADHIDTRQPAELIFNALATRNTLQSPAYAGATGTCNTTYCHANTRVTWIANTTTQNPVWNNTGLLTGAASDCTKCHLMRTNGTNHKNNADCSSCHDHLNAADTSFIATQKWKHIDGVVQAKGDCLGCHNARQPATAPQRAIIVDGAIGAEGDDFKRKSRHVSDGTTTQIVTNYDCILCHAEGNVTSSGTSISDTAIHKDGVVDLRNVDNQANPGTSGTNYYPWPGWRLTTFTVTMAQRRTMDNFCMGCHDTDGAADINVNGTNNGMLLDAAATRDTTPFNTSDNLGNAYDALTRSAVLNVKSQFNSGNLTGKNWASHHNLEQFTKRYTTSNTTYWPANTWATYTPKISSASDGDSKTQATLGVMAGYYCADCHLNESNAHGTRNTRYMLADSAGTDTAFTTTTNVCYRCHNVFAYNNLGGKSLSKGGFNTRTLTHNNGDASRCNNPADADNAFGVLCFDCHAGTVLGEIHGTNATYNPYNGAGTSRKYRFMSGAVMRYYSPDSAASTIDADWEGTLGVGCYTTGADAWNVGSCNQHGAGESPYTSNWSRPLAY